MKPYILPTIFCIAFLALLWFSVTHIMIGGIVIDKDQPNNYEIALRSTKTNDIYFCAVNPREYRYIKPGDYYECVPLRD